MLHRSHPPTATLAAFASINSKANQRCSFRLLPFISQKRKRFGSAALGSDSNASCFSPVSLLI